MIRVDSATDEEILDLSQSLMEAWTSCACWAVATFPVPTANFVSLCKRERRCRSLTNGPHRLVRNDNLSVKDTLVNLLFFFEAGEIVRRPLTTNLRSLL